ncbi:MotE family protein [Anaerocellum danielii]|uniref:Magnesium transporter MgtE intracellular domain-containing protein n=1 Tax=Anaerocellum danielii TaxID=1387557 RepID=A0ABZ0U117_9FIRM|nr:hypothetical protein [Caldicellulosiruptor danielii]WPX08403.1 hypothetical protein SOJ16_002284 [Caldicellulosiruptor danielii]
MAETKIAEVLSAENKPKKKEKKKRKGFLIFLIVFLILAGLSFATVYFNLFDAKNVLDGLIKKTPFAKSTNKTQNINLREVYEKQIAELQKQKEGLQSKLSLLEKQNANLQKQIEDLTVKITNLTSKQQDAQNKTKYFASLLQNMDAKKAAKIIENLLDADVKVANSVLEAIPSETASEILSNIAPEKTIKILGISNSNQKTNSEDISILTDIYKKIDPKIAASIFENMMSDNTKYNLVINILKSLDTKTSSQIISNMSAESAAKVTSSLSALK